MARTWAERDLPSGFGLVTNYYVLDVVSLVNYWELVVDFVSLLSDISHLIDYDGTVGSASIFSYTSLLF